MKLQEFQKIHNKIIQKQLQSRIIKKLYNKRYVSPEDRQQIIDKLRLKSQWQIWDILQGVSSLGA